MQGGGKHAELIWHRRSGKDEICLHHAAIAAFERVANYWHMLPEYAQARRAIWDAVNPHTGIRRIDEAFPAALRQTVREQEMQIVFRNGSTWQVVGSDNYDRLVGSTPAGIVYSEWALANPAARGAFRPILAENGGWQVYITTPRGRNHAYRTFNAARHDPQAFAQLLSAHDTGVFDAATLELERRAYVAEYGEDAGLALYQQEYECSFDAAIMGAVLGRWHARAMAEGRLRTSVFDPAGQPVSISGDLGRRDTCAWWFWQPVAGGHAIVGYLDGNGMDADEWTERIQEYVQRRGFKLGRIWLPHDARSKTFTAKHTAEEIFISRFGARHVRIVPLTSISDRINAARRVIRRCVFDEVESAAGIEGLNSWRYDWNEDRREVSREPIHDWASHPGDAFSYGAQAIAEHAAEPAEPSAPPVLMVGPNSTATLEDLWAEKPRERTRIA